MQYSKCTEARAWQSYLGPACNESSAQRAGHAHMKQRVWATHRHCLIPAPGHIQLPDCSAVRRLCRCGWQANVQGLQRQLYNTLEAAQAKAWDCLGDVESSYPHACAPRPRNLSRPASSWAVHNNLHRATQLQVLALVQSCALHNSNVFAPCKAMRCTQLHLIYRDPPGSPRLGYGHPGLSATPSGQALTCPDRITKAHTAEQRALSPASSVAPHRSANAQVR